MTKSKQLSTKNDQRSKSKWQEESIKKNENNDSITTTNFKDQIKKNQNDQNIQEFQR